MLASLSQAVALILGIWLIGVSLFMVFAPRRALEALSAMGGSGLVHFGELGLRTAAESALVGASSLCRFAKASWVHAASVLSEEQALGALHDRGVSVSPETHSCQQDTVKITLSRPLGSLPA